MLARFGRDLIPSEVDFNTNLDCDRFAVLERRVETELLNGCDRSIIEGRPKRFFYVHLLWLSIGINQERYQADSREFFSFESFGRKIWIDGGDEYRSSNGIGIWLWRNVRSR
jgi:hypothetical protein